MVTQAEATELIRATKIATRAEVLSWRNGERYDEAVVALEGGQEFVLTLGRNPFEVKAHFRTKHRNVHLARIDSQMQHINPDGTVIRGTHIHWFREGFDHLSWAEPIDWADPSKPIPTLERFLSLINTKFPNKIQEDFA